jgi:hypothetical protein
MGANMANDEHLPGGVQICPTCGNANTASQTTWSACCLRSFDFGGGVLGLLAASVYPDDLPATFGVIEARLILRRWGVDKNGVILLSAGCRTLQELDAEIALLRRDLRDLRKQAGKLFAARPGM